jgi:hypothetical protein
MASRLALNVWLAVVLAAAAALLHASARAQDIAPLDDPIDVALTTGPLLPEKVLRSSALTFPAILEAFEREAAARGDQLSADGAFDLMLRGEVFDRVTGTFDGGFAGTEARQGAAPARCRGVCFLPAVTGPLSRLQRAASTPPNSGRCGSARCSRCCATAGSTSDALRLTTRG